VDLFVRAQLFAHKAGRLAYGTSHFTSIIVLIVLINLLGKSWTVGQDAAGLSNGSSADLNESSAHQQVLVSRFTTVSRSGHVIGWRCCLPRTDVYNEILGLLIVSSVIRRVDRMPLGGR